MLCERLSFFVPGLFAAEQQYIRIRPGGCVSEQEGPSDSESILGVAGQTASNQWEPDVQSSDVCQEPEGIRRDIPPGWPVQPFEQSQREQHPPSDRRQKELAVLRYTWWRKSQCYGIHHG